MRFVIGIIKVQQNKTSSHFDLKDISFWDSIGLVNKILKECNNPKVGVSPLQCLKNLYKIIVNIDNTFYIAITSESCNETLIRQLLNNCSFDLKKFVVENESKKDEANYPVVEDQSKTRIIYERFSFEKMEQISKDLEEMDRLRNEKDISDENKRRFIEIAERILNDSDSKAIADSMTEPIDLSADFVLNSPKKSQNNNCVIS